MSKKPKDLNSTKVIDAFKKFKDDRKVSDIIEQFYGEWWQNEALGKIAPEQYMKNQAIWKRAMDYHKLKNRKLEVLVIHGSPRSNSDITCAHELSNSQLLLEKGLEAIEDNEDINIERINLREYNISPCNGCVSTASALCGASCDCFPLDPMKDLYPKFLISDVILLSTGVNQSMPSSRVKIMMDRMISLDGGFWRTEFNIKNAEFRTKMIELSKDGNIEYAQRMFGRVAAYFISSKDQNNPYGNYNYIKNVAEMMKSSFDDYGIFHSKEYYASASSKWYEDYSHDKRRLNDNTKAHDFAKKVILEAVKLAEKYRINPPEFKPGRKNRT